MKNVGKIPCITSSPAIFCVHLEDHMLKTPTLIRCGSLVFVAAVLCLELSQSPVGAATTNPSTVPSTQPIFDPPLGSGKLLLSEDFESTPVGQIPNGFTRNGSAEVVDDVSYNGTKSMRLNPTTRGSRGITLKGDILKEIGGTFWGRLYFKVKLPAPVPPTTGRSTVIHSTLVMGAASSPLFHDPIEVRMFNTVVNRTGKFEYLYNVQPSGGRREFSHSTGYDYQYSDQWTLVEWYIDYDTQTFRLFINGEEIKKASFSNGAGNFQNSEIPPVFTALTFGWNNYQAADPPFTTWIDHIALSKERIGNLGIESKP
jgi:hypothetical protein